VSLSTQEVGREEGKKVVDSQRKATDSWPPDPIQLAVIGRIVPAAPAILAPWSSLHPQTRPPRRAILAAAKVTAPCPATPGTPAELLQEGVVLVVQAASILRVHAGNVAGILLVHLGLDFIWKLVNFLPSGWALKLPVTSLPAEVAELLVLEGAVQSRELPELHPLVLVPCLVDRLQQLLNHVRSIVDILLGVSLNEHVQVLVLAVVVLRIPRCAFLDGALAPDGNLRVCFFLHPLLCVAAWTDDQPDEVVTWVLLLRDENLTGFLLRFIVRRWAECRGLFQQLLNQLMPALHHSLPCTYFSCVLPDAQPVINRLRRRRAPWVALRRNIQLPRKQLAIDFVELHLQGSDLWIAVWVRCPSQGWRKADLDTSRKNKFPWSTDNQRTLSWLCRLVRLPAAFPFTLWFLSITCCHCITGGRRLFGSWFGSSRSYLLSWSCSFLRCWSAPATAPFLSTRSFTANLAFPWIFC